MIYRLSILRNSTEHEAYEFYSSLAAAKRRRAELLSDSECEHDDFEIDCEPPPRRKKQILWLLNYWASHADNG